MPQTLLTVKNVSCARPEGDSIFSNVTFDVNEGDVIVLQARSGAGKTTLLKCLAHLNLYQGAVAFLGKSPRVYGVPTYRTHVQYVPQRPSLLPGTPRELLVTLASFYALRAQTNKEHPVEFDRVLELTGRWGIDPALWDRAWNTLSGGEAQRLALAIPYGMNCAEILLLDEPTSALDLETSEMIERSFVDAIKEPDIALRAIVWITHSEEQAMRVGTRFLTLTPDGVQEETPPAPAVES
ncbi:P-loop containing nucleoside triphosphate hydrolase protein [Auriscalpium vulgare]|uniref:P-loop containing nucleoside triphosphate hydrolase protein n=1 Tax=Auriscalpium vulgare TaxID=40419 RepID=A0ACB8SBU6_9AGAM|nr:P-loop containing nucleoside triphosphate hydrolase protein [Auriscalpium vulgare]